jgi:hypothetical protein
MSTVTATKTVLKGAEWLVKESLPFESFTPENFNEEQFMIRDMCNQFLEVEIYPILDRIDSLEPGLMKSLVTKAGEQGLLATSFPEQYGGLGKDFITSTIINEYLGAGHSFSVAIAAHTGIGTLPILYFGTDAQKEKYIPKLITGEWAGAYGLTEPNSGSDALGAKTTAKLSDDGKYYILNGQVRIPMVVSHRYTLYSQKWTAISLPVLLWIGGQRDLHRALKRIRWVLRVHQLFSYISRIVKYR